MPEARMEFRLYLAHGSLKGPTLGQPKGRTPNNSSLFSEVVCHEGIRVGKIASCRGLAQELSGPQMRISHAERVSFGDCVQQDEVELLTHVPARCPACNTCHRRTI